MWIIPSMGFDTCLNMFELWLLWYYQVTPLMALEEIMFHHVSVSQGMKWPRNCVRLTEIVSVEVECQSRSNCSDKAHSF